MPNIRLTEAEARKLGIAGPAGKGRRAGSQPADEQETERPAPSRPGRKTQTVRAKDCLPNRCCTCGEVFTGETAEARHNKETGHARFEAILKVVRPDPDH